MIYKINLRLALLAFLIAIGIIFRFYDLSWGAPYFFHPDERNIASAVNQLSFKKNLNPNFFAYGSLPIYSIYFTGVLTNSIQNFLFDNNKDISAVKFEDSILIGRVFAACLSVTLLYLIFKTGSLLFGKKAAILSVILSSFSIGYLQYSHFSTFEMWLSLLTLFLTFTVIKFAMTEEAKYFLLSSLTLGALMSVKISSLAFLPLCLLIFSVLEIKKFRKNQNDIKIRIVLFTARIILFLSICLLIIYITSPFFWADNSHFRSSISYESSVAIGTLKVFYTKFFDNSIPIIYQLVKVFPFILNPFVEVLSLVSLVYFSIIIFKKRNPLYIVFTLFFLTALISQLFLYVKWIRYYIPTLSYIYLFSGFFLSYLMRIKIKKFRNFGFAISVIFIAISIFYSFSFIKTVYINEDSRVSAAIWASKNIPPDAKILSEVYDMGIVPFNKYFENITLFNYYELENDAEIAKNLPSKIKENEYIILPSQRIFESRLTNPITFPKGYIFYKMLINGKKYKKIYETKCDFFCSLVYSGNAIDSYEQTANVFDRPVVQIFKKVEDE